MNRRTSVTALALAALFVAAAPSYAAAATAGRVALYADSTARIVNYDECTTQRYVQVPSVTSFTHNALSGCVAQLVKDARTFTLCDGRGAIPPAFRTGSTLRIKPGLTPTCPSA